MVGIYKITNPKGRVYVGQSIDIEARWKQYKTYLGKGQIILERSIKKYGIETHTFETLEECLEQDLNQRERYWQDYYEVLTEKGLNCKLTKTEHKSGKMSEEAKKKMSVAKKGKSKSERHVKQMSEQRKGRKLSEETRRKISEAHKGRELSEEHRKNISKGITGRVESKKAVEIPALAKYRILPKNAFTAGGINPMTKTLIHIATGQEFKSCTEAASYFKISKNTVTIRIKQGVFIVKQS